MKADTAWRKTLQLKDDTRIDLEPFTEADLEAILRIERRSHRGAWQPEHFTGSLRTSHHYCLGARRNHQWIGYAIVSCAAGEAELLLLVTDLEWQGLGVASGVLRHLFQVLSGIADTIFLEVRASNDRAIQLYENLEFNQVGVRPNYYPSGSGREDALLFARTLLKD